MGVVQITYRLPSISVPFNTIMTKSFDIQYSVKAGCDEPVSNKIEEPKPGRNAGQIHEASSRTMCGSATEGSNQTSRIKATPCVTKTNDRHAHTTVEKGQELGMAFQFV